MCLLFFRYGSKTRVPAPRQSVHPGEWSHWEQVTAVMAYCPMLSGKEQTHPVLPSYFEKRLSWGHCFDIYKKNIFSGYLAGNNTYTYTVISARHIMMFILLFAVALSGVRSQSCGTPFAELNCPSGDRGDFACQEGGTAGIVYRSDDGWYSTPSATLLAVYNMAGASSKFHISSGGEIVVPPTLVITFNVPPSTGTYQVAGLLPEISVDMSMTWCLLLPPTSESAVWDQDGSTTIAFIGSIIPYRMRLVADPCPECADAYNYNVQEIVPTTTTSTTSTSTSTSTTSTSTTSTSTTSLTTTAHVCEYVLYLECNPFYLYTCAGDRSSIYYTATVDGTTLSTETTDVHPVDVYNFGHSLAHYIIDIGNLELQTPLIFFEFSAPPGPGRVVIFGVEPIEMQANAILCILLPPSTNSDVWPSGRTLVRFQPDDPDTFIPPYAVLLVPGRCTYCNTGYVVNAVLPTSLPPTTAGPTTVLPPEVTAVTTPASTQPTCPNSVAYLNCPPSNYQCTSSPLNDIIYTCGDKSTATESDLMIVYYRTSGVGCTYVIMPETAMTSPMLVLAFDFIPDATQTITMPGGTFPVPSGSVVCIGLPPTSNHEFWGEVGPITTLAMGITSAGTIIRIPYLIQIMDSWCDLCTSEGTYLFNGYITSTTTTYTSTTSSSTTGSTTTSSSTTGSTTTSSSTTGVVHTTTVPPTTATSTTTATVPTDGPAPTEKADSHSKGLSHGELVTVCAFVAGIVVTAVVLLMCACKERSAYSRIPSEVL